MTQLRVIIIDDDQNRREMIRDYLPDYVSSVAVKAGETAMGYLKPDTEGILPDLVIINGDDSRGLGLYIYDWMINRSPDPRIANIPVIVLTEDEFSDRSMEFLEIGDAMFYEGEIDGDRIFTMINDAIEAAEFAEPVDEPSYEETKSIDRLIGRSVKAEGQADKQRAIVLDMDNRLENLEAALERGKKRVADIRTLLDSAQDLKEDAARKRKREPEKEEEYIRKMSSYLEKAHKKNEASNPAPARVNEPVRTSNSYTRPSDNVIKHDRIEESITDPVNVVKQKAISNPYGAFGAQGSVRMEERPKSREPVHYDGKRTIVLVDDDVKTRKLCSLFLTQNYRVVALDSGIKTVDYFVKNRADLLIINPMLKGMNGVMTVSSVRLQPGCSNVPVMYLVGDDFTNDRSSLMSNGVVAILNKPIKRETIARAVEGLFGQAE